VELTQCPYDSTPIDAEFMSGGSMLRRIREPNRDAVVTRDEPRHTEPA
jgi:hypothetical protein